MTADDVARIRSTAAMIRDDMAADVAYFEGQEFNGRNVSRMFGRLAAAISALSMMVDLLAAEQAGVR